MTALTTGRHSPHISAHFCALKLAPKVACGLGGSRGFNTDFGCDSVGRSSEVDGIGSCISRSCCVLCNLKATVGKVNDNMADGCVKSHFNKTLRCGFDVPSFGLLLRNDCSMGTRAIRRDCAAPGGVTNMGSGATRISLAVVRRKGSCAGCVEAACAGHGVSNVRCVSRHSGSRSRDN